jgi:hypothetical protein
MKTEYTAIQTFTHNSLDNILEHGGDYSWSLSQNRAKSCNFLVCTSSTGINHGSSFLVAKINGVDPSPLRENRYIIRFAEFATIDIPKHWPGNQNPVRYTTLEELGIDPSKLTFKKVLPAKSDTLTIDQAKTGLSKHYGVSESNIEIIIRG